MAWYRLRPCDPLTVSSLRTSVPLTRFVPKKFLPGGFLEKQSSPFSSFQFEPLLAPLSSTNADQSAALTSDAAPVTLEPLQSTEAALERFSAARPEGLDRLIAMVRLSPDS